MLDEQYLRQDVPCGVVSCPVCETNPHCRLELCLRGVAAAPQQPDRVMSSVDEAGEDDYVEPRQVIDKIFIIDHHFALNQFDLIENCDVLANVVLPDSVLKHVNKM